MGQGAVGAGCSLGALHRRRAAGGRPHRDRLGRADRAVRRGRGATSAGCSSSYRKAARVNLLPRPRRVELGDWHRARAREPDGAARPVAASRGLRADDRARRRRRSPPPTTRALFYARRTLAQLRSCHDGELPVGTIRDWPDLPVRGVMLDISRDKVPDPRRRCTRLVDRLASWKVNQVQLYSEHTFAYRTTRRCGATRARSPPRRSATSTRTAATATSSSCRTRTASATWAAGCATTATGRSRSRRRHRTTAAREPPTTIDPANPGSLALVRELLAELLPNFTSRTVHVGLDEPWELPDERIDDYLDWVRTLRALPELDGREMLVWGDILAGQPERHRAAPRRRHGRASGATRTGTRSTSAPPPTPAAGKPFWVAPGHVELAARSSAASTNMRGTCACGRARPRSTHGGAGLLNTDWGDLGHLQYLPDQRPGLAYGAAVSWCLDDEPRPRPRRRARRARVRRPDRRARRRAARARRRPPGRSPRRSRTCRTLVAAPLLPAARRSDRASKPPDITGGGSSSEVEAGLGDAQWQQSIEPAANGVTARWCSTSPRAHRGWSRCLCRDGVPGSRRTAWLASIPGSELVRRLCDGAGHGMIEHAPRAVARARDPNWRPRRQRLVARAPEGLLETGVSPKELGHPVSRVDGLCL